MTITVWAWRPARRYLLPACYTVRIVTNSCFWTLLLALGLWFSFQSAHQPMGGMCHCSSGCTCGCCMNGGTCPMMMGKNSRGGSCFSKGSEAGCSRSHFTCMCAVSHPGTAVVPSHTDLIFGRPAYRQLPGPSLSLYCVSAEWVAMPIPNASLPDPPPKAFSC